MQMYQYIFICFVMCFLTYNTLITTARKCSVILSKRDKKFSTDRLINKFCQESTILSEKLKSFKTIKEETKYWILTP